MSQQQTGAVTGTAVGEGFPETAIADYLKDHPDFFERHSALLLGMQLPHQAGASVSLVERQISMLRQRNVQLERQLKELVSVAKENDMLVEKLHQLSLKIMGARDLPGRLEALETSLREDFASERAVLVLFDSGAPSSAVREGFVKRLAVDSPEARSFATFLRAGKPRCGPLRDRQKDIFDRDADTVTSAALVPLGGDAKLGFLIIGSHDPEHFHPSKRMDFLARLGELLAVIIAREP